MKTRNAQWFVREVKRQYKADPETPVRFDVTEIEAAAAKQAYAELIRKVTDQKASQDQWAWTFGRTVHADGFKRETWLFRVWFLGPNTPRPTRDNVEARRALAYSQEELLGLFFQNAAESRWTMNSIPKERRQELEALADRLAETWHSDAWRYKLSSMQARYTLPPVNADGTQDKPELIDTDRLDLPDFAAWRDAILKLHSSNIEYGVDDPDVAELAKHAEPFPRIAIENSLLHGAISARLAPDAAERRKQRQGRVEGGRQHHRQAKRNADGKTVAYYRDRFSFWHGKRKSSRGAAVEVARESGFTIDAIRAAARRDGWLTD